MSEEIQRALLGSILHSQGALLDDSDIRDTDFSEGKYRDAFRAAVKLKEDRGAVDPLILAEALGGNGGVLFITDLIGGLVELQPASFRDRLSELRRRRLSTEIARLSHDLAADHIKRGELDEEKLDRIVTLIAKQDALRHSSLANFELAAVLKTSDAIRKMDIMVRAVVGKLIYENAINLLAAPGGTGKTTLSYQLGDAVATGREWHGLATLKKRVIVIDYENPLALVKERLERLAISNLEHWTLSADPPPPGLDSDDWVLFKALPADSVIVIDSLRSGNALDENSSQDMSIILGRLKQIRDGGRTILLLHHSPKAKDRTFRGSGAISDLADHTLTLCRVKATTHEELPDDLEPEPGEAYFFGCNGKSRFEKGHIYLTLSGDGTGFSLAEDPKAETLRAIAEFIAGQGAGSNQGEILTWAKEAGVGPKHRNSFVALLKKGENEGLWRAVSGFRGARVYEPPTCT